MLSPLPPHATLLGESKDTPFTEDDDIEHRRINHDDSGTSGCSSSSPTNPPTFVSKVSSSAALSLLSKDDSRKLFQPRIKLLQDTAETTQPQERQTLPSSLNHENDNDKSHDLDWNLFCETQDSEVLLYDRQDEQERLLQAFERHCTGTCLELVLVSGQSGTGKTALAKTLQKPCVEERGGYFITGKFDQLQRPEPYGPFVAAFTEFTHQILARRDETSMQVQHSIQQALDSEGRLLVDMIPALELLLSSDESTHNKQHSATLKGSDAQQQLKLVFCNFVRAICSPLHPLVLLMDDLQWADAGSLDLLHTLLLAGSGGADATSGFMILGTCRYNEVTLEHPLAVMLRQLEDEAHVPITNILVRNLTQSAVRQVVSTALQLDSQTTQPLADMVHSQTAGNVFFVMQFLRTMYEEGVLCRASSVLEEQQHDGGSSWQWDSDKICLATDRQEHQDVVVLVARQLKRLEPQVQEMLMVAACIGAEFDEYLLHDVLHPSQVAEALSTAVRKGLVHVMDRHGYRFTHDKVQQAAYSLIPQEDLDTFHLSIGRHLWKNLSNEEIDMNIFLVINQLSRGIELVDEQDERYGIAMLCLRAGEKATLSSDFVTAAAYLGFGIDLLGSRGWRDQYDLSLTLYNAAAEAEYCTANFDRMDRLVDQVLLHARSFQDKLRAYTTQVYSLGTRQRLQEAIDKGFDVLERLGEPFPSKPRRIYKLVDMMKTKRLLSGKSDNDLLCLTHMHDPEKVAAMQMLNLLFTYTFLGRADFLAFVVFRMIRLTLKYGVSAISALGFSSYGLVLCGSGDIEAGYRYGQLAIRILNMFNAKEWWPRVYTLVYGMNNHWKVPLRECLEPLKYAHKIGLETGDIEYSMVGAHRYCYESFSAGRQLNMLEEETNALCTLMGAYKQEIWTSLTLPLLQLVQNFMGQSENPLILTGKVIDQEVLLKTARDSQNATLSCCMYMWRMILAYYFNDYNLALEMAIRSRPMKTVGRSAFAVCLQIFYDGLTNLALARETRRRMKYVSAAKVATKKLRRLVLHCPENCANKLLLMEAEFAALRNNVAVSVAKYEESMAAADKQDLLHEKALACERASLALSHLGDATRAQHYLERARSLYHEWGAFAKVEQMEDAKYSV